MDIIDQISRLLMQVHHDSPWGLAIKKWQANPNGRNGWDTVALASQLKCQAEDNPALMEEILGPELTKLLLSCQ